MRGRKAWSVVNGASRRVFKASDQAEGEIEVTKFEGVVEPGS